MTVATCSICGEPMPATEQMFKYHGYSGPCPRPPLAERTAPAWQPTTLRYETAGDAVRVSMSEADFIELRRLAAVAPAGMVLSGHVSGYLPRQQAIEIKADSPLPPWLTSQPLVRVTLALAEAGVAPTPPATAGQE